MNILDFKKLDWNIINTYFNNDNYYFTSSQINSYNDFISNKLPYTVKTLNPFTMIKDDESMNEKYEVNIYIGNEKGDEVYLGKPVLNENNNTKPLYPNESRLKDLSYVSDLYANILVEYIIIDTKTDQKKIIKKVYNDMNIGIIPIMTHSKLCILNNQPNQILTEMGECPYDQGGYFIISGKEKVIISQERIATNTIFISKTKVNEDDDEDIEPSPFSYDAYIRCTSEKNILFPKTINFAIFKDKKYILKSEKESEKVKKLKKRKNAIVLTCPNINNKVTKNSVNIPLFIMFRALGIESDKEILNYIISDTDNSNNDKYLDLLRYSILDANYIYSQTEALEYLSKYVEYYNEKDKEDGIDNLKYILTNDFLPNVGDSFNNKAYFLGYLIKKFINVKLGINPPTNRDNYLFKRVDLSGYMLSNLFRDFYNKFRRNILNTIDRQYYYGDWRNNKNIQLLINDVNINQIFDSTIIKNGMIDSFKGNWGQEKDPQKSSYVQDLERLSYLSYLSHVRRINTPMDRSIKFLEPRKLAGTQYGSVCPVDSPDGPNIGLIKHFSILSSVTYDINVDNIIKCLIDNGMIELPDISTKNINNSIKIFINNNWIGIHFEPEYIYKVLITFRRVGIIDNTISISWYIQDYELRILADAGRFYRPLYIVNDNKLLLDDSKLIDDINNNNVEWNELFNSKISENFDSKIYNEKLIKKYRDKDGKIDFDKFNITNCVIENIDVEESNTCMIAMNRKYLENKMYNYTHCEIDPSTTLSSYANIIPFADHNQSPRNVYSAKQGKAAIGIYATNFNNRIDTSSYIIHYPQRALVHTKYSKYTHNEELPNGENIIVAIATYTGFNQEDSVIVNKSSIERGMFNITKFKSFSNQESENDNDLINEKNIFSNPIEMNENGYPIEFGSYYWNYIDKNGIPKENSYIQENDVILGKVRISKEFVEDKFNQNIFEKKIEKKSYTNVSIVGDETYNGFIDKVYVYEGENNLKKIKLRFRKFMIPDLGDKMGSRHGQKGVCGMIYNQEDMPFNKDGIVPDIIINPHAIPSRMTVGHLIECVLCKLGCKMGVTIDGTTFNNQKTKELYNLMDKKDLHKYGDEILYNGLTGEQISTHIFFGPTYYYRLKQLISDKMQSRNKGAPITTMTRQPTKGRANDGGLRIGEMETNAILSHGLGSFLKESMMERSDKFDYYIENNHGTIAIGSNKNIKSSYKDENIFNYSKIETPYSFKLLLQELEAFSIKTSIITDEKHEFEENYENSLLEELKKNDYAINLKYENT